MSANRLCVSVRVSDCACDIGLCMNGIIITSFPYVRAQNESTTGDREEFTGLPKNQALFSALWRGEGEGCRACPLSADSSDFPRYFCLILIIVEH